MASRFVGPVVVAVLAASLCCAASAFAAVTTNIDSPANHTYLEANQDTASTITFHGTTTGMSTGDKLKVRCYFKLNGAVSFRTLPGPESDGTWLVQADGSFGGSASPYNDDFSNQIAGLTCVLRAVPATGFTDGDSLTPFTGPTLAISEFGSNGDGSVIANGPNAGKRFDYFGEGASFAGQIGEDSPGDCGPFITLLDSTLEQGGHTFGLDCGSELYGGPGSYPSGVTPPGRSLIQVDGENVYDTAAAFDLFGRSNPSTFDGSRDNPGFPNLEVSHTFDSSNGLGTFDSVDNLVKCPTSSADPNRGNCPQFLPAGVRLERKTIHLNDDRVAWVVDIFDSVDGRAHALDVLEEDDIDDTNTTFELPGESAFIHHATGQTAGPPPGTPGTIRYRTPSKPQDLPGSITFSTPYSDVRYDNQLFSTEGSILLHHTRMIPAGGRFILTYAYGESFDQSETDGYAAAAEAAFQPPVVSINAPVQGALVGSSPVTVTGRVTGGGAPVDSLLVNGQPTPVNPDGTWSRSVTPTPGANTATAVATTIYGAQGQAARNFTFVPSAVARFRGVRIARVVLVMDRHGRVTIKVICPASASGRCVGTVVLTSAGPVILPRDVASAARKKKGKRVKLGSAKFSIPAGKSKNIKVKIATKPRKLILKRKKLKAVATITSHDNGGASSAATNKTNVTIKAPKAKKRRH